jgi:hypothetical protein
LGSRFYGGKFENNKVCSVLSFLFLENEMTEDVSVKKSKCWKLKLCGE